MRLSKRLRQANPLPPSCGGLSARAEQEMARLTATAAAPDAVATPAQPNLGGSDSVWTPPRRLVPSRTPRRFILAGAAATAAVGIGLSWVALHDFDGGTGGRAVGTTEAAVTGEDIWEPAGAVVVPANWPAEFTTPINTNTAWGPDALIELPDVPGSDGHAVMRLWIKLSPDQAFSDGPAALHFELQPDGTYLGQSQSIDGDLVLRALDRSTDRCDSTFNFRVGVDSEGETTMTNCAGTESPWSLSWADGAVPAEVEETGSVSFGVNESGGTDGIDFTAAQIRGSNHHIYILQGTGPDRDSLVTAVKAFELDSDGTWTVTPSEGIVLPPAPAELAIPEDRLPH